MADLMRARYPELDVVCEVPDTDFWRGAGWVKVDDATPLTEEQRTLFDPAEGNVDDVVAYLSSINDEAERQRVLEAEKTGKKRASILGWKPSA